MSVIDLTSFLNAQQEIIARLKAQKAQLERIRVSDEPLVNKWQMFLHIILLIQREVIKELGFSFDQAGLSAFNEQLMAKQLESKELRKLNEQKWQFIFKTAFGLKKVVKITREQAQKLIKDIVAAMTSEQFLQEVDKAMADVPEDASMVYRRQQLLTALIPLHVSYGEAWI